MTVIIVVGVLLACTVVVALVLRSLSRRADSATWSSGKKKSNAAGLAGTMFVDGGGCGGCGCGG